MGIFSWIFPSRDDGFTNNSADFPVNPANGLPMVNGIHSVDVMGNPYGTNVGSMNGPFLHCESYGVNSSTQHTGFGFDDFSCCGGSGFAGGFGNGMNDW